MLTNLVAHRASLIKEGDLVPTEHESWHCGYTKVIPYIVLGKIVDYRYVIIDGCGEYNLPESARCWECGRDRPGHETPQADNRAA